MILKTYRTIVSLVATLSLTATLALGCADQDESPPRDETTQVTEDAPQSDAPGLGETRWKNQCCVCTGDDAGECTSWTCSPEPC
jgi:hypothetical protein